MVIKKDSALTAKIGLLPQKGTTASSRVELKLGYFNIYLQNYNNVCRRCRLFT